MNPDDVIKLTSDFISHEIEGEILYKSALMMFENKKKPGTAKLLKAFIKKYNDNHNYKSALSILDTLYQRDNFNKYLIGVLLPLSGYFEPVGKNALIALEIAVNEFNFENNTDFKLEVRDTESDIIVAKTAVETLNSLKVACIIGPMITAQTAAIKSNSLKIPIVTLTQKADIPNVGEYVFRNFQTPFMQVESIVYYCTEALGFNRFAILYPDEKYGHTFLKSYANAIGKYDGILVEEISYKYGSVDFSNQIKTFIRGYQRKDENGNFVKMKTGEKKIRNKIYRAIVDFDVLFIPDSPKVIGMLAPQLKYHDIHQTMLAGTNLWHSEKLLAMAGKYVNHSVFPDDFYNDKDNSHIQMFSSAFEEETGRKPGYVEANAYDTGQIMMSILNSNTVKSRKDVIERLKRIDFRDGVTCPTSFNSDGEAVKDLNLFQIKGDKIQLLWSCMD